MRLVNSLCKMIYLTFACYYTHNSFAYHQRGRTRVCHQYTFKTSCQKISCLANFTHILQRIVDEALLVGDYALASRIVDEALLDGDTAAAPSGSSSSDKKKVAVAITVTKDGEEGGFLDGAAVLAYSLRRTKSKYQIDFYAIVLPKVVKFRKTLQQHGYTIIEADPGKLIDLSKITNEEYRTHLPKSGCCGAEELIKLEAFKLKNYHKVQWCDALARISLEHNLAPH